MDSNLPSLLLQLFRQVKDNPTSIPAILPESWEADSLEGEMLANFRSLLEGVAQREQELERLKLAVEGANDGFFYWDLVTDQVYYSPLWAGLLGYRPDEITPDLEAWRSRLHPDDREKVLTSLQAYMEGRSDTSVFEYRLQHKDGSYRWMIGRTALQRDSSGKTICLAGFTADITTRKEAEEQLREKEEQYRSIFEASKDGLIILDIDDGHLIAFNPAMHQMHGYTSDEFRTLYPTAYIHPSFHPAFQAFLASVREGEVYRTKALDLHKDGSSFPIEVYGTNFIYKGKNHVLAVIRDITKQTEAEERLLEKEAQYRSIFEASADGLVINDLDDGHLVEFNPAMHLMHGYTYDEFMALYPTDFIHPSFHPAFQAFLSSIREGNIFRTKALDVHKDGSPFPVEVYSTTFTYKGKPQILSIVRDITKQTEAEERLHEKEAQYRSIFEATTDGLIISSLEDATTVEVNPALCKMFGYTYEELLALPKSSALHPSNHYLTDEARYTIQAGEPFDIQTVVTGKDGRPFYIEVHASMFLYKGTPHILSVVRNVTEQIQAKQLLEQRVTERTRELSTLLDISQKVSSTMKLQPLLGLILEQLKTVVDYCCAAIATLDGQMLSIIEHRSSEELVQQMQLRWPIERLPSTWKQLCQHRPVPGSDLSEKSAEAREIHAWFGEALATTGCSTASWMVLPFTAKERTIGALLLFFDAPDYYTARHISLALAIAQQMSIALENARLYERAQEMAALEERQRLARELHDSVSQALYGISLGAHTARQQLERDPSKVREPLEYVLLQAEAALTEMRALIFELRPESLASEGLVAALSRQCTVLRARSDVTIVSQLEEPEIPLEIKQELYRLVQEALHNIMKHARANKVKLSLHWNSQGLTLEICDDGVGFDSTQSFPGHLGLHSMRERVARLGGTLTIESVPDQGTNIYVQVPPG